MNAMSPHVLTHSLACSASSRFEYLWYHPERMRTFTLKEQSKEQDACASTPLRTSTKNAFMKKPSLTCRENIPQLQEGSPGRQQISNPKGYSSSEEPRQNIYCFVAMRSQGGEILSVAALWKALNNSGNNEMCTLRTNTLPQTAREFSQGIQKEPICKATFLCQIFHTLI